MTEQKSIRTLQGRVVSDKMNNPSLLLLSVR